MVTRQRSYWDPTNSSRLKGSMSWVFSIYKHLYFSSSNAAAAAAAAVLAWLWHQFNQSAKNDA